MARARARLSGVTNPIAKAWAEYLASPEAKGLLDPGILRNDAFVRKLEYRLALAFLEGVKVGRSFSDETRWSKNETSSSNVK